MMRYSKFIVLLLVFAQAYTLTAQENPQVKIEREERISIEEFPENALDLVTQISKSQKKIKFYKETDGYLISYEAKYKYNGHKYSAEFNNDGILIDIEKRIKKKEILSAALTKIKDTLSTFSKQFKIEKIQEQYITVEQDAFTISLSIEGKEFNNYEIIVAFKEDRKIYRKEILFSKDGVLLKQRNVKRLGYDFLLF